MGTSACCSGPQDSEPIAIPPNELRSNEAGVITEELDKVVYIIYMYIIMTIAIILYIATGPEDSNIFICDNHVQCS